MPHLRLRILPVIVPFILLTAMLVACTGGGTAPTAAGSASPSGSPSAPPISSPASTSPLPSPATLAAPRPAIVSKPIPFPDLRKAEMAAYARRHYGLDAFRLEHPRAIVEHYTGSDSFEATWNTFASNAPDLGELPGTCAHFVIDGDGTIYQLVPLDLMCRHASGMNWTAFGIEMVATSDQEVLANPRQLDAALRLTVWLMARFGIQLRNVIGHNENLTSPLRIEHVDSFKCQTHADWNHADMDVFRSKLADLARRYDVPLGPPASPVDIGC
jgi:N-acetylmuramoyl-L-alanine amidase